ncbi:hypothetical protein GCM10022224_041110 [Nonomuraea antimicrobica]|uniref:Uncharacterized protein n=1 Tax=Nonomuraea antimicrobica TaxID=561173 RepID=A0ABP7BZL9_9ACTN
MEETRTSAADPSAPDDEIVPTERDPYEQRPSTEPEAVTPPEPPDADPVEPDEDGWVPL